ARPEARDRHRARDDGLEERHRHDPLPLLLEEETRLDEAAADPARLLRERRAEEAGLGERGPGLGIEALVVPLDRLQPVERAVVREDLARQLGERLLLVGEGEVHARCAPRRREVVRRRRSRRRRRWTRASESVTT